MILKQLYQNQSLHMSSIYHELKTPMNGIVCSTELVSNELSQLIAKGIGQPRDYKVVQEWLNVTKSSSISLNEMIENMLIFCKVKAKYYL